MSLETLFADVDRLDVLHMDVQGVELDVLRASKATVDRKVSTLIVGTHSTQIEAGLRELFADWRPMFDFAMGRRNATDFGEVDFGDGLQVWINPAKRAG